MPAAAEPGSTSPPPASSEDCLTLNVQVPTDAGPGPLPVMVEIHGGGFVIGSPPNQAHLAATGHVIAVAVHYRLGILGFLAEKALGQHSGDYGLQDQQAALRWVKRKSSRFGGDPGNVTLFGQSAGGASVCDAAASPPPPASSRRESARAGSSTTGTTRSGPTATASRRWRAKTRPGRTEPRSPPRSAARVRAMSRPVYATSRPDAARQRRPDPRPHGRRHDRPDDQRHDAARSRPRRRSGPTA